MAIRGAPASVYTPASWRPNKLARSFQFALGFLVTVPVASALALTSQTIDFPPFDAPEYRSGSVNLIAAASSGLKVRFVSATPDVCVTTSAYEGVAFDVPIYVNLLREGICTVTAYQDGDDATSAAPTVTRSLTVTLSRRITFTSYPVAFINRGPIKPETPVLTDQPYGSRPSISSLTPSVCFVEEYRIPGVITPGGTPLYGIRLVFTDIEGVCTVRTLIQGAELIDQSFPVVTTYTKLDSTQSPALVGTRLGLAASVQSVNSIPSNATVQFIDKGTSSKRTSDVICNSPVVNGRATCELQKTALGANFEQQTYTARYRPTSSAPTKGTPAVFLQSFAALKLGVSPQQTAIGAPIRLLATLPSSANSTVSFARNGVPIADCTASPLVTGASFKTASCLTSASEATSRFTASSLTSKSEVTVRASTSVAQDRTNHWWAGEVENGWGMVVNQHGETPFVTLYIYDEAGKPDWLVMPGIWDASKTALSGDLYRPAGSPLSNYDPALFNPGESIGRGNITFLGQILGTEISDFTYTIDGVKGTKGVRKLPINGPAGGPNYDLSDIWWNPLESGWGVSITHQNNAIFAVWFTYGSDGKVIWYPMPGGSWNGNTYTGTLYRTTSSRWLGVPYDASKFRATAVGTMSFRFLDTNTADTTYTVDGITQTKTITRQPY
jgi:hypothetical protein